MVKSRLQDGTEPAVFLPEVAKQHYVFAGSLLEYSRVLTLVSDWIKRFGNLHEDLPIPLTVNTTTRFFVGKRQNKITPKVNGGQLKLDIKPVFLFLNSP